MSKPVSQEALDTLFNNARTYNSWNQEAVSDDLIKQLDELVKMGPTSANCCPMRVVYVKSEEAKAKLKDCLMEGNVEKTMTAPVCAIIGMDMQFYEKLPQLFPHTDAKSWFVGKEKFIESTAFRNSSLQGGYFIMAARALGLDCGPMSGFSPKKINETFFAGTSTKVNFLCNLGYGTEKDLFPRSPRLDFDEANSIV
ncbi:malonic semialdehyde reductase [Kangiella sp. HZ709]|uniref:malonic semialdehyde reductase n=1 Tax=Kangiella sp. HZ709 TaxID=2666328 RepID=UPI0012AF54D1|nr:malonic semialdehyde reductase [Kangiella sp. HZ709]MRX28565.1 malonic semialdehyde reductase [Kangiella sp. HZ709]